MIKDYKDYPIPGRKYKHYKGGVYEIVSMATHTETQEAIVVYKSLLFGSLYVRPLDIWNKVALDDDEEEVTRFELIDIEDEDEYYCL
jgi:hypothetical protein